MLTRDFNDLYYFVQVAQHRGFAPAARAIGLPKSTLSRRIQALESRLGVRLIQRTSRQFVVTELGEEFLRHARAMLVEADAAESSVQQRLAEPSGTVRFTCPVGMAPLIARLLPRFLEQHPKVTIEQHASNRPVDLVEEGFDVAIRAHLEPLADSTLISRMLLRSPWVLVASRAWLDRVGRPRTPDALAAHAALVLGPGAPSSAFSGYGARSGNGARATNGNGARATNGNGVRTVNGSGVDDGNGMRAVNGWVLHGPDGARVGVELHTRLRTDDVQTLRAVAVAGAGIAAMPEYLCRQDIDTGVLEHVLPEWTAGEGRVTALVPSRRGQLPSVRAFVDYLAAALPAEAGVAAA